jgi:SOS-response transcriptional repressor LexA
MISGERVSAYRKKYDLTQPAMGELLGVTGKYVAMIERGAKEVSLSSPLGLLFQMIEAGPPPDVVRLKEDPADYKVSMRDISRKVPVVSWAHAGEAGCYEELPQDWQHQIATDSRDPHAFAVEVEGESMEPKFSGGDILVLSPSTEPYSGCLAVCRFKDDGIIFRRIEMLPDAIRLVALNPAYQPMEYPRNAFAWIYVVDGRWTQIAKTKKGISPP